jgi:tetratricopeptide (TPR) repeat protein
METRGQRLMNEVICALIFGLPDARSLADGVGPEALARSFLAVRYPEKRCTSKGGVCVGPSRAATSASAAGGGGGWAMLPELLAEAKRLHRAGDLVAAELLYRQVLFYLPAHAETHFLLAACCHTQGKLQEAVTHYRRTVWLMPNCAQAYRNLALALQQTGRLQQASRSMLEALRLDPSDAEAHTGLADMRVEQGRYDEAVAGLQEMIRICPGDFRAYSELGRALQLEGRPTEAVAAYREALRLHPGDPVARSRLGTALAEQGRVAEAIACFQEALQCQPDYAVAWYNLGDLARHGLYQFADSEPGQIRSLLDRGDLPIHSRGLLCFTLAYACEKAGDFDQAFAYFSQANDCRKQFFQSRGRGFDAQAHTQWIGRLMTTFTREYFRRVAPLGLESELPVLVVGMPRSGTSLVEQILASHPQIHGAGELTDIQRLVQELPEVLQTTTAYPECVAKLDPGAARELAQRYVRRLRSKGGSAARVIDKSPENFFHLGLVSTLLPRARIIFCRRQALDICVSCHTQNFGSLPWACDLQRLAVYYQQYERLLAHWRAVLPQHKLEVQHEELVLNPEAVSRQLIAFCDLDWDEKCLAFEKNPRAVQTASRLQVHQPIHGRSISRWQRYERHLGPLIEALSG